MELTMFDGCDVVLQPSRALPDLLCQFFKRNTPKIQLLPPYHDRHIGDVVSRKERRKTQLKILQETYPLIPESNPACNASSAYRTTFIHTTELQKGMLAKASFSTSALRHKFRDLLSTTRQLSKFGNSVCPCVTPLSGHVQ